LGRLVRYGLGEGRIAVEGDEGGIAYGLQTDHLVSLHGRAWSPTAPTLFVPSREVLALYEGFVASYLNRELSLGETYYDVCVALNASNLRGPRADLSNALLASVETLLGGKVELVGNRFEVVFAGDTELRLEAHLVAEGLRKIGSLARLIENGSIRPGSLLVWDEPEANLNARLVTALVPILHALAAAGVQIVLATHDYLLAKRLSLLSEASTGPVRPVKFFLLSRADTKSPVGVSSGATLVDLPQTPMEEEFLRLYDDEHRVFLKDSGA